MENDADDLDNLFDEYESISRPEIEENTKGNENEPATEAKAEVVAVPKRVIRKPRLKFDPERLCGERGIPVLVNHFKDVKFKGKGYEKEDLNKLLASLTHWCHRLFPSMKFDDCLRQIEKLGKKRPVQTCLRKIRFDMPILNDDFIHDDENDDEGNKNVENELPPEDEFDRLFNETREASNSNFTSTPIAKQSSGNVLGSALSSNLTEEQRQRMEHNRLLAAERRKAKLATATSNCVPDDNTRLSNSATADVNSNVFDEGTSSSELKSATQNKNFDFANSESPISNMDTETVGAVIATSNCVPDDNTPLSDSGTVDVNSNIFEEGTSSSDLRSQIQNKNFEFANSESLISNMDTETVEAVIAKTPEELDMDELMDLVNDENTCIESNTDNVFSNTPELSLNSEEGSSKVAMDSVNEDITSDSPDITVPHEDGASN